jgi:hypothetical protein
MSEEEKLNGQENHDEQKLDKQEVMAKFFANDSSGIIADKIRYFLFPITLLCSSQYRDFLSFFGMKKYALRIIHRINKHINDVERYGKADNVENTYPLTKLRFLYNYINNKHTKDKPLIYLTVIRFNIIEVVVNYVVFNSCYEPPHSEFVSNVDIWKKSCSI